jgi:hypothetical protein
MQIAMLVLGAGFSGVGFWQLFSPRRDVQVRNHDGAKSDCHRRVGHKGLP